MRSLELLAPARNIDIGIAAIDCGADAVYIAGPDFGARHAAGNSMEDIARLCSYAHRYGARIFLTLNTILYENELEKAYGILCQAEDAGVDAVIAQDLAVARLCNGGPDGKGRRLKMALHASTQCAIRDVATARFYRSLGFSRLVLERELSLERIAEISSSTDAETEVFVHGALCVCYSGQCYMSEAISGRSANRGECIQACRSLYDLTDMKGNVIVRNKALLSLKDLELINNLRPLADAGAVSFKIEGRLKNISYVRNTVRAYSLALDRIVAESPELYSRASYGRVTGGFTPDPERTFNRGYTELYLSGEKGKWASLDTPKGMGQFIGTVRDISQMQGGEMRVSLALSGKDLTLRNGDGFAFTAKDNSIVGFRGDICQDNTIRAKAVPKLVPGMRLYRNIDSAFEKTLESNPCHRYISVVIEAEIRRDNAGYIAHISASTEDGRVYSGDFRLGDTMAENEDRMREMFRNQLGKSTGIYAFSVRNITQEIQDTGLPLVRSAELNEIRRTIAGYFDTVACKKKPLLSVARPECFTRISAICSEVSTGTESHADKTTASPSETRDSYQVLPGYKYNVSNSLSKAVYAASDINVTDAYELTHEKGIELMRTRYCVRFELGLCPFHRQGKNESPHGKDSSPLLLHNNGKTFRLEFDCRKCEMTVKESREGSTL